MELIVAEPVVPREHEQWARGYPEEPRNDNRGTLARRSG
jgi:hypothetical protein